MILYLGNMLSRYGKSVNFIELLAPKLAFRYEIKTASNRKNKILRLMHMIFAIGWNCRKCKVVLIDTYSTTAFWYAYLIAKICFNLKVPYIPILHGGSLGDKFQSKPEKIRWLLSHAKDIVSPSLYLHAVFTPYGFKIRFIPNFIEISRYPFKKRYCRNVRVLWVRAFHSIYNPMMAVETMSVLKLRYSDAELCMIGGVLDNALFESIQRRRSLYDLDSQICFTGALQKEEWIRRSEEFSILINTTNVDNMPVSVIECMALGLPVVSTNVGGMPFLISDGVDGILVNANDAKAMSAAIVDLIENPRLAASISEAARRKVEKFDWSFVGHQWYDLLDPYFPFKKS